MPCRDSLSGSLVQATLYNCVHRCRTGGGKIGTKGGNASARRVSGLYMKHMPLYWQSPERNIDILLPALDTLLPSMWVWECSSHAWGVRAIQSPNAQGKSGLIVHDQVNDSVDRSCDCLSRPSELVARLAEAGALSKRVDPARRDREHWDRHLFALKGAVANLVLPSPVPLAGPRRG